MNDVDVLGATCVLARTPTLLSGWLSGLPDDWIDCNEGAGSWSPREVVAHLIVGERTDWIPRVRHILQHGDSVAFEPFDRFAHLRAEALPLAAQLDEFARLRSASLAALAAFRLAPVDLERRGRHPELGVVTLGQHLATWVAHDLSHVAQIARVMARRCEVAIGPWRAYLPIVEQRKR